MIDFDVGMKKGEIQGFPLVVVVCWFSVIYFFYYAQR